MSNVVSIPSGLEAEHAALVAEGLAKPREAAEFLGICRASVFNLISAGHLPCVRVGPAGRDCRIPRVALRQYAVDRLSMSGSTVA
jgi:excisionase family DNA binding protein